MGENIMNLTPIDIRDNEFKKVIFGGYNKEEVDSFIEMVALEFEKIVKENRELKDKLDELNKQIANYENLEKDLKDAILMSQKTSQEIKDNASQKAELIIKEAELKARSIIDEANLQIKKQKEELNKLIQKKQEIYWKLKNMLQTQLSLLEEENFDNIENLDEDSVEFVDTKGDNNDE